MDSINPVKIKGVDLTALKIIERDLGNIMHALKNTETSYVSFGEAYFTFVKKNKVKGWKKHTKMILNLVVPTGKVKFVLYDDRKDSETCGKTLAVELGRDNYQRLTIAPGIWIAFQGLEQENMILNLASIPHDPEETEELSLDLINYKW